MNKKIVRVILLFLLVSVAITAGAQDGPKNKAKKTDTKIKELSGISIMGDEEAPKSLFIIPWKSSDLGNEVDLSSWLLNEEMRAVDKEVFERELDFYSAVNKQK